ncbi:MAG: hypothetical protein U0P45_15645 [Acidimicrobiales bacterium]
MEGTAFRSEGHGTAYLEAPDPAVPEGHPRARRCRYASGVVAYDQFAASSPIRALYEWDPFLDFLSAVMGRQVFRYADPLGALNLAVMTAGDELQWHYDQTDFVVSLALQASDQGGTFDVVPKLRADGDERYDQVAAAIDGSHPGVAAADDAGHAPALRRPGGRCTGSARSRSHLAARRAHGVRHEARHPLHRRPQLARYGRTAS